MEILYPVGYGTQLVTFDVLRNRFEPHMHPEAARRGFNFILWQEGFFGIGSGYRPPGTQPDNKPGFAPPGDSFHEGQQFPSGLYYTAWDMVVRNPGPNGLGPHRAPMWSEVPIQGSKEAIVYGWHMNVSTESWHAQPIELDGHDSWVKNGRKDLKPNYPIKVITPPQKPSIPTTPKGSEMSIAILELVDAQAVFMGLGVNNPDGTVGLLEVTWVDGNSPEALRMLELHRQNPNTIYPRPRMEAPKSGDNMYGAWICKGLIVDRLPSGDAQRVWVPGDFGMVRNL